MWWYKIKFQGQVIRESTKSNSKRLAKDAERARRRELEEGFNGIRKLDRSKTLSVASREWVELKRASWSPSSVVREHGNLKHILLVLGKKLIPDIDAQDLARYQQARLKEKASPKTVNHEIATVRAILRRYRRWASIQPDVTMLKVRDDVGQAITAEQEARLLAACSKSRSRSLRPIVETALNTCMRVSEIRLLTWGQVDFGKRQITVGLSKTEAGEGRVLPINDRLFAVLSTWAANFPFRQPEHYVFPSEKYGAAGDEFTACSYETVPTVPLKRVKEAWEAAKKRTGDEEKGIAAVDCRFHDLRHTGCTRMLEAGVPFAVVQKVMGWSTSTAIKMANRYGHIGDLARRDALSVLGRGKIEGEGANFGANLLTGESGVASN